MKQGSEYIVFPLDVSTADDARRWVERLHGHVGMFKVGFELFLRTGPSMVTWIREQARTDVFLDLKLHDIPNTVRQAASAIADLDVTLTTVHCGESQAMLEAAVHGCGTKAAVLGVTVLTSVSAEDLRGAGYGEKMVADLNQLVLHKAALAQKAGCAGVVCSGHEVGDIKAVCGNAFLTVTPGIRPAWLMAPDDQRRVMTPEMAVSAGADYLVIGRPIREAADPPQVVQRIADDIESCLGDR
jgi:orotidine-5'-phosphate decarboxylase